LFKEKIFKIKSIKTFNQITIKEKEKPEEKAQNPK
jgi:hypothetical protein